LKSANLAGCAVAAYCSRGSYFRIGVNGIDTGLVFAPHYALKILSQDDVYSSVRCRTDEPSKRRKSTKGYMRNIAM